MSTLKEDTKVLLDRLSVVELVRFFEANSDFSLTALEEYLLERLARTFE